MIMSFFNYASSITTKMYYFAVSLPNWTHRLHVAVENDDRAEVNRLIDNWLLVDAINLDTHETALTLATKKANLPMVKLLVSRGASVETFCAQGLSPLHHAVLLERRDMIEYFVKECGLPVDYNPCKTKACNEVLNIGSEEIMALLVELGAQFNADEIAHFNHVKRRKDTVKGLTKIYPNKKVYDIDEGLDFEFKNAVDNGKLDVCLKMLEFPYYTPEKVRKIINIISTSVAFTQEQKRAHPQLCSKFKNTARTVNGGVSYFYELSNTNAVPIIFQTVANNDKEMTQFLVEHGANVNYVHQGITPVLFAEKLGHVDLIPILQGIDNNQPDSAHEVAITMTL